LPVRKIVWHSAAPVEVGRGVEVLEGVLVDDDVDDVDILGEVDVALTTLEVSIVEAEILLEEVIIPSLVPADVLPDVPADVLVFVLARLLVRLLVDDSDPPDEIDEVLVTADVDVLEAVAGMIW